MSKILIIGGGAAGMMAGVYLARAGHEVHILEKNEKLGKKVYILPYVNPFFFKSLSSKKFLFLQPCKDIFLFTLTKECKTQAENFIYYSPK